jgi:hypothetical protein
MLQNVLDLDTKNSMVQLISYSPSILKTSNSLSTICPDQSLEVGFQFVNYTCVFSRLLIVYILKPLIKMLHQKSHVHNQC